MNMVYQEYLKQKNEQLEILLQYIDSDSKNENGFQNLIKHIENQKDNEKFKFNIFFSQLFHIAANHHRAPYFFEKIKNIILHFKSELQQSMPNYEIWRAAKNSRVIVAFLLEQKIIKFDQKVYGEIMTTRDLSGVKYSHFLYQVIRNHVSKRKRERFDSKFSRYYNLVNGENESYLCKLIREDSITEFKKAYSNKSKQITIPSSHNETNSLLIKRPNVLFIEYAAYYGSTKIFNYLRESKEPLNSTIWIFAVHSNSIDFIKVLRQYIKPDCYNLLIKESINCFHNDLAKYFIAESYSNEYIEQAIECHNFAFFPDNIEDISTKYEKLFHLCYYKLLSIILHQDSLNIYKIFELCHQYKKKELLQTFLEDGKIDCDSNNKVQRIVLPSYLKRIVTSSFYNLTELSDVVIPNSVLIIDDMAFMKCSSLKQITIPSSVTSIGSLAFADCRLLEQITIPSSVASIGSSAFLNCGKLSKFIIPTSINVIRSQLFAGCKSLNEVTIPSSVTKIEQSAFENCLLFNEMTIPSSVVKIEKNVFSGCINLKKISIPSSVIEFGRNIFNGVKTITITGDIVSLPSFLFYQCSSLVSVNIESPIISIGDSVFKGCNLLNDVTIPSSLISIGDNVFEGCINLNKRVLLPLNLSEFGDASFNGCSCLKLSNGTERILPNQFKNCASVKDIEIPSSVASIGSSAFYRCLSLLKLDIPAAVTRICVSTFERCQSLTEMTIPPSVKSIESSAFKRCTALSVIFIPSSVTKIDSCAFNDCSSLMQVSLPANLAEIGSQAFLGCTSLKQVLFEDGSALEKIGDFAFALCRSLERIKIPKTVKNIGKSVFEGCVSLLDDQIQ